MSNANYTPLGTNRKVFGGGSNQVPPLQQTNFVDAMGKPIERQFVSGACTKCGYAGHLPYQCRNNMSIEIDGTMRRPRRMSESSSPSSNFETPLQKLDRQDREREAKRLRKKLKKMKKKQKKKAQKRKRSSSSSSSSSGNLSRRQKSKKSKKEKIKSKKSRRRSSSSSD